MVMGEDSCSKGREFESWHCILDGHFSHSLFIVKIVMCVWKDKHKLKRGRGWPIFKKDQIKHKKEIAYFYFMGRPWPHRQLVEVFTEVQLSGRLAVCP